MALLTSEKAKKEVYLYVHIIVNKYLLFDVVNTKIIIRSTQGRIFAQNLDATGKISLKTSNGAITTIQMEIVVHVELNAKMTQHAKLLNVVPLIAVGGQKELVTT